MEKEQPMWKVGALVPLRGFANGSPHPGVTSHTPQDFSSQGEVDGSPSKSIAWLFPFLFCPSEPVSKGLTATSEQMLVASAEHTEWLLVSSTHSHDSVFRAQQIRLLATPKYSSGLHRTVYESRPHVSLVTIPTSWPLPMFSLRIQWLNNPQPVLSTV